MIHDFGLGGSPRADTGHRPAWEPTGRVASGAPREGSVTSRALAGTGWPGTERVDWQPGASGSLTRRGRHRGDDALGDGHDALGGPVGLSGLGGGHRCRVVLGAVL